MLIYIDINRGIRHHRQTFKIEDKLKELEGIDFDSKNVVIAVPTFDEKMRHIEKEHKRLFVQQECDALYLTKHFKENTDARFVDVILDDAHMWQIIDMFGEPIDYLILLHQFTTIEKRYMIRELREDCHGRLNTDMKIIELH